MPLFRLFFVQLIIPQGYCNSSAHSHYGLSSWKFFHSNLVTEGQRFNDLNSSKWNYSIPVMLTFLCIIFDQNKLTGWYL